MYEAKQHVDGCGGDSLIAVLRNTGTCGKAWDHRLEKITNMLEIAEDAADELLISFSDLDETQERLVDKMQFKLDMAWTMRESIKEEIKSQEAPELHNSIDLFGLPLPKQSKTAKGQQ